MTVPSSGSGTVAEAESKLSRALLCLQTGNTALITGGDQLVGEISADVVYKVKPREIVSIWT